MKNLDPLYEILASIVYTNYTNAHFAVQKIIPGQIKSAIELFESAPIEAGQQEAMKESVMWFMYENRRLFDDFNDRGDYTDEEYQHIIIRRFQIDAERTRVYLELWERNKESKPEYQAIDF